MSTPEIDPVTAAAEEQDADIAGEHDKPTLADERPPEGGDDESVPDNSAGMDKDGRPL